MPWRLPPDALPPLNQPDLLQRKANRGNDCIYSTASLEVLGSSQVVVINPTLPRDLQRH